MGKDELSVLDMKPQVKENVEQSIDNLSAPSAKALSKLAKFLCGIGILAAIIGVISIIAGIGDNREEEALVGLFVVLGAISCFVWRILCNALAVITDAASIYKKKYQDIKTKQDV